MYKSKPGIWPPPVYEAHFANGTVGRCSFWSPLGKPIDFTRGRRVAALLRSRPERGDSKRIYPPREVVSGFIEHETIGRVEHVAVARKPVARKPALAKLLKLARVALELGNAAEALEILKQTE